MKAVCYGRPFSFREGGLTYGNHENHAASCRQGPHRKSGDAVKYTPAGGKIAVSVVLWEMYVEIKVTDTGKGISESNQAAIFRRFYREEEVHEQQGVGIGLYLAREIVTRQGGYIKVVSEPGKGSEFSIMLPTK